MENELITLGYLSLLNYNMNVLAWCNLSNRGDCKGYFRVHKTHTCQKK